MHLALGGVLRTQGQYIEARELLIKAQKLAVDNFGQLSARALRVVMELGRLDTAVGAYDQAARQFTAVVDAPFKGSLSFFSPQAQARFLRADLDVDRGRGVSAVTQLDQRLADYDALPPEGEAPVDAAEIHVAVARALLATGNPGDAEQRAVQGLALLHDQFRSSPRLAEAQLTLARCYADLHEPEKAREWLANAKASSASKQILPERLGKPLRELETRLAKAS